MSKPPPIESLEMFADPGPRLAQPIPAGLTLRKRRTALRQQQIALGKHPLVGLPLHPLAPPDADSKHRKPRPYVCGTCVHLVALPTNGRSVLDCELSTSTGQAKRCDPACIVYRPRPGVVTTGKDTDDVA